MHAYRDKDHVSQRDVSVFVNVAFHVYHAILDHVCLQLVLCDEDISCVYLLDVYGFPSLPLQRTHYSSLLLKVVLVNVVSIANAFFTTLWHDVALDYLIHTHHCNLIHHTRIHQTGVTTICEGVNELDEVVDASDLDWQKSH